MSWGEEQDHASRGEAMSNSWKPMTMNGGPMMIRYCMFRMLEN